MRSRLGKLGALGAVGWLGLVACVDRVDCPTGQVSDGDRCVPEACGDCTSDRPVCDVANALCVECIVDADCTAAPARGFCDAGRCVACLEGTFCDDAAAPICSESACAPCEGLESCGPFGHCDGAGVCVECRPDIEAQACTGTACDPVDLVCGDAPVGSLGFCAPCVATSECAEGRSCVAMTFLGEPIGDYCAEPAARDLDCPRDWVRSAEDLETREGGIDRFCVPFADTFTCPAFLDGVARKICESSDDCGLTGAPDGACFDGVCTVACRVNMPPGCLVDGVCGVDQVCLKPS